MNVLVVHVIDGADFDRELATHAFLSSVSADKWGMDKVDMHRRVARIRGETDEVFLNAIRYTVEILPLGE